MKLPANPIINAKTCQDVNPWVGRKQLALAHIPDMHPILRRTGHRLFVSILMDLAGVTQDFLQRWGWTRMPGEVYEKSKKVKLGLLVLGLS